MMIALRSLLYNIAFYVNTIVQTIIFLPFNLFLPRKAAMHLIKFWARSNMWLMKIIAGTSHHVEGLEHLPTGSFILASKHQSYWDTFVYLPILNDPTYILKKELRQIPVFGWYIAKQRMIPIDRAKGGKGLAEMLRLTKKEMAKGRQLIIYPEGTRQPPGAPPDYKSGISRLYKTLDVPIVPVVLHAGLFWPRKSMKRYPGHIKVQILPAIPTGLTHKMLMSNLQDAMEPASDRLLVETLRDNPHLPVPESAKERLSQLRQSNPELFAKERPTRLTEEHND